MNKLFIPELGQKLKLTKKWEFSLVHEERNMSMVEIYAQDHIERFKVEKEALRIKLAAVQISYDEVKDLPWKTLKSLPVVKAWQRAYCAFESCREYSAPSIKTDIFLPKGTILEVDRIYIRKGAEEYSSITFKIRGKKVLRFWVKLQDANNIEFGLVN